MAQKACRTHPISAGMEPGVVGAAIYRAISRTSTQNAVTRTRRRTRDTKIVDELNKEKREEGNKKTKPMPIIITGFLGLAALVVLLSRKYDAEATKWAIGILGVVAGFWARGSVVLIVYGTGMLGRGRSDCCSIDPL
jgi:hypothetical protein